jgi:hypothetical protein
MAETQAQNWVERSKTALKAFCQQHNIQGFNESLVSNAEYMELQVQKFWALQFKRAVKDGYGSGDNVSDDVNRWKRDNVPPTKEWVSSQLGGNATEETSIIQ